MTPDIEATAGIKALPWLASIFQAAGQSHFVEVEGRRLHYLEWGAQHTTGPVLLLVHGLRAHARWWDCIAPLLAERFRVLALDLSGMGDSDHRDVYPAQFASMDIVDLIERRVGSPVIGIGHSFGGSRLLRACVNRPDLFQRLIICDSFILFKGVDIPADTASTASRRYYPDQRSAISRYRLMPEQPGVNADILQHIACHSVRETSEGWCWKFDIGLPRGVRHEEWGENLLPQVRRPVDVVFGERSVIVDQALASWAVELLPFGRGPYRVADAHHHMMIDQPEAMLATLRTLLGIGESHE